MMENSDLRIMMMREIGIGSRNDNEQMGLELGLRMTH